MVAMVREDEEVAYFASGVPLFVHRADDAVGRRVAAVQMMELGLARQDELSAALQVNRSTLYRQHRKLKAQGVLGRGRRQARAARPASLHAPTSARGWRRCSRPGMSIRQAAQQVGVTEGTIRHALRRGELRPVPTRRRRPRLGPRTRSEQARDARAGGRGGAAAHRARAGAPGAVDRGGPALRGRRGGALWRGVAGAAGGADARGCWRRASRPTGR